LITQEGVHALAITTRSRVLLLAGIAAAVVLTVAIAWVGFLEPDYSHMAQFVSELGALGATHQEVFNYSGLVLAGLLTAVFSVGLHLRLEPGRWFIVSSALVALAGIGRMIAGLFPCDPGCNMEDMSVSARIHALAGFVALLSGALAPLLLAFGLRERPESALFRPSLALGLASVVLVVLLFGLGPGAPFIGAIQRLVLAAFYGWVAVVAVKYGALQWRGAT